MTSTQAESWRQAVAVGLSKGWLSYGEQLADEPIERLRAIEDMHARAAALLADAEARRLRRLEAVAMKRHLQSPSPRAKRRQAQRVAEAA